MKFRNRVYSLTRPKRDIFRYLNPIIRPVLLLAARRRLPQVNGEIWLKGVHSTIEVIRDRWGVAHIYAAKIRDMWYGQGFVHAQDRFWQMEFNRRLVAGRLAEIMGKVAVSVDRWMRTLTIRRTAEAEYKLMNDEAREDLDAYTAGVNAYIEQKRLPMEFWLLNYQPEPWTPADTLSWAKMMGWSMSVNWEMEILRARMIEQIGPELASELEPNGLSRCPTIIPEGIDFSKIGSHGIDRSDEARPFLGPSPYEGIGSNNWVVSGMRTESGKPLLANDMHLNLSIPAIWYENHIKAEDIDAVGISLPGVPGILSGHNGKVAWALTNGFPDVQDLYMENIRREDDGRVSVEYQGEWYESKVFEEVIKVRGAPTVTEHVIVTRHGPVINSLAPDVSGEQSLALRWTALEPGTMLQDVLRPTLQAKSCQEFHESLGNWAVPALNFVYADVDGNIAYTHAGKIPIRKDGDGRLPVPGWIDRYEWVGYIPFEDLPHMVNPKQGFVVTANNRVVGEKYPYNLGGEMMRGDRAQRISELLQNREWVNSEYYQKMQFDQVSPQAQVITRLVGELNLEGRHRAQELKPVVQMMGRWDGNLSVDSTEATIHQVLARELMTILISRTLGMPGDRKGKELDLALHYSGKGVNPVLQPTSLYMERSMEWLEMVLQKTESHWFDQGGKETRDDILYQGLCSAYDYLNNEFGPRTSDWNWGRMHLLTFDHILGTAAPLREFFNRGPFQVGGDGTTIWATHSTVYNLNSDHIYGPPYRMIIDLGDLRNSLGLLAPGQSGHIASKHYDDQVGAWFKAGYHP
ncbi:MAG: penicillin acylase family protein, partial [Chloroflexi bacterium]